jgi:site-specific DNA-cytosine methylase
VDKKYYLSEKIISGFLAKNKRYEDEKKVKGFTFSPADIEKPCSCLNARYYKSGAADIYINTSVIGLLDHKGIDQKGIRKLTTLECWRLQDFPDEAHNKAKASGVSQTQLYKQAGNSMSVNVLEMIFKQIELSKIVGSSGSLFDT